MFRSLTAGVAALSLACAGTTERPKRVVLISIDTLRADHLGFYGYERPTSPILDALALESTVLDDVTSASPWTLPSHASLLTGLYPRRHGLTSHERYLASDRQTLAQWFSHAGYTTAAVVSSHNLSPAFGLDRGFQRFRYVEENVEQREPSTAITDQAISWLDAAGDDPLFLFVHYYDVHSDYVSLPRYEDLFLRPYEGNADGSTAQLIAHREGKLDLGAGDAPNLIDRYDAGIRQMDDELGRLLAFLRERGMLDDTFLVVTSDHGEEFFEHGGVLHGKTQFQEVLRVPLLLRGPGVPPGRRIRTPVSLVDVAPTLLDFAGIPVPEGLDGGSLTALWSESGGELAERYLFSEADHNNLEHDMMRAVRHREMKLHYNRLSGEYRLYDLSRDPGEHDDLAEKKPPAMSALEDELDRFMASGTAEAPTRALSEEEIDKLRSLGYVR
ncbi:MAG TPA: sulfatase [Vicinamibacteria bacterium]|nr:sulfatase [Vicinamibacteria bacterium]